MQQQAPAADDDAEPDVPVDMPHDATLPQQQDIPPQHDMGDTGASLLSSSRASRGHHVSPASHIHWDVDGNVIPATPADVIPPTPADVIPATPADQGDQQQQVMDLQQANQQADNMQSQSDDTHKTHKHKPHKKNRRKDNEDDGQKRKRKQSTASNTTAGALQVRPLQLNMQHVPTNLVPHDWLVYS